MAQGEANVKATTALETEIHTIIDTQADIQQSLMPALEHKPETGATAVFLAGLCLGMVLGLFFASYLVKIGRMGGRKQPAKGEQQQQHSPRDKEFAEIVHKQGSESASYRTGTTRSNGSDHNGDDQEAFL